MQRKVNGGLIHTDAQVPRIMKGTGTERETESGSVSASAKAHPLAGTCSWRSGNGLGAVRQESQAT